MATVLIDDQRLKDIADSIRKMRGTKNLITVDSMPGEIEQAEIVWDPEEKWHRPLGWPDYSQIDISNFEGMYFTYDTTVADGRTEWVGLYCACNGGFKVERGQITNGVFVAEQSTNVGSGAVFREWLPSTITGYIVYRITPQVAGAAITSIGMRELPTTMTGDGRSNTFYFQSVLERYGRLPNLTSFSNWGNVSCKSDTILDLKKLTSLYQTWIYSYSIENIDLTGFDSIITSLQQTFYQCKQLRYLNNTDKFVTSSCTSLYYSFYECSNLQYIDSSTWNTSNINNMQTAFCNCHSLYKLDVSGWDTSRVTTFYATFANCHKIRYLDVSGFNTSKATSMYQMFHGCHRVKEIDVSNFETGLVTNMAYMFSTMICVKTIDCSSFNTSKVTNMSYMFTGCRGLEELDVSTFNTSLVTTMQQMFYNCGGLKNLDLSNFNFQSCTNFADFMDIASYCQKTFELDLSTATASITNVNYLINNNQRLISIDLTGMNLSGVTNPGYMFRYNYSMEKCILPSSLHSLGQYNFDGCRNLKVLVMPSTTLVTLQNANSFSGRNNCPLTIYVPDNLVASYQTADVWKTLTYVTFAGLSTYEE